MIVLDSLRKSKLATKETKLISLQFKIIQYILPTQKRLHDWKISETALCQYCSEIDTLTLFFWDCTYTEEIIHKCFEILKLEDEFAHIINKLHFLFAGIFLGILQARQLARGPDFQGAISGPGAPVLIHK